MKIAVCDDDPNAMEIFSRYAAAIIEYAFAYEFFLRSRGNAYII